MGASNSKGASTSTEPSMIRAVLRRVLRCIEAGVAPNPYFDVETLLASVESGAIAAVKGTWLVGLHKRGGRLSRRQDLPPEAFWSADELKRVARALGDDFGVLFVALSYRWLTKEHPDGVHLGVVAPVAELYLNLRGEAAAAAAALLRPRTRRHRSCAGTRAPPSRPLPSSSAPSLSRCPSTRSSPRTARCTSARPSRSGSSTRARAH